MSLSVIARIARRGSAAFSMIARIARRGSAGCQPAFARCKHTTREARLGSPAALPAFARCKRGPKYDLTVYRFLCSATCVAILLNACGATTNDASHSFAESSRTNHETSQSSQKSKKVDGGASTGDQHRTVEKTSSPGREAFQKAVDKRDYFLPPRNDNEKQALILCARAKTQIEKNPRSAEAVELSQKALALAPDHPVVWNTYGMVLIEQDGKSAIEAFEKAVGFDPLYVNGWINLGLCYAQSGNYTKANRVFKRILTLDPKNAKCMVILGRLYLEEGNGVEAVQTLKTAITFEPKNVMAHSTLAYAYHGMRRWREAEQMYQRTLDLDPGNEMAMRHLGLLLVNQGRTADAERVYEKVVSIHPESIAGWRALGTLRTSQKDIDGARKAYRMITKYKPNSGTGLVEEAMLEKELNQNKKALALLEKAKKASPTWYRPWHEIGKIYMDENNFAEAEKALSVACQYGDHNPRVWNSMGCTLAYNRKLPEAEKAFRKAVNLEPTMSLAWANLSETCRELGKKEDAKTAALQAVRFNNRNPLALVCLALAKIGEKKTDEAISLLNRALEVDPNYSLAWDNLGVAYAVKGDAEQAINCSVKATKIDPNNQNAWKNLAGLYAGTGNKKGQAQALKMAAKARGSMRSAEDLYGIAYSLESLGHKSDASMALKQGLEMEPEEADVLLNVPYVIEQHQESGRVKRNGGS